ncbi:MAG: hypothetical protein ACUVSL_09880, partial [Chloroflexus sp.]
ARLRRAYYLAQHALLTRPELSTLGFSKLGYCQTFSRPQRAMHYPHVTLRYDRLHALPAARASNPRVGIIATAGRGWSLPLVRRHEPGATTYLRAGSLFMPDQLDDRHEHIQHLRDQDG